MTELVINKKDRPITTSKQIAEVFEKEHKSVLRDIKNIEEKVSKEFWENNFAPSNYKARGKSYPMYIIAKDGFTILAMGYNGEKAMEFKELYIKKFNSMERTITSQLIARQDCSALTDNIKLMHENPQGYHFSNELNMINKIVLGKTAKDIRKEKGLSDKQSIRPYLSEDDIYYLEKLQTADIGIVLAVSDFTERKKALKGFYYTLKNQRKLLSQEID